MASADEVRFPDSVCAPSKERRDARARYERARRVALPTGDPAELDALFADLEGLLDNERLYTAEHRGYAQVVGEENKLLREQLDAANRETGEYRRMWEETLTKLDAATAALMQIEHYEHPLGSSTRASFDALQAIARAALGDVAAAPNQTTDSVSAPSKNEGRAGDKEA